MKSESADSSESAPKGIEAKESAPGWPSESRTRECVGESLGGPGSESVSGRFDGPDKAVRAGCGVSEVSVWVCAEIMPRRCV